MKVLVIDVGGTHVKILATGQTAHREFESGATLSAAQMVEGVLHLAEDWPFDAVAVGYPGPVVNDRPIAEPHNLGRGWVGYDYARAFGRPVRIMNDAAMQALGSYRGGKMLFLGFGTGLGTAMVTDGIVQAMELGHLPYRKATYEDYVGVHALEQFGKKKWRKNVLDVVTRLVAALEPEEVVLGGGNVKLLKELPTGCRAGDNANAFIGGFRLWPEAVPVKPSRSGRKSAAAKTSVGKTTGRKKAATGKTAAAKKSTTRKTSAAKKAAVKRSTAAHKTARATHAKKSKRSARKGTST